MGKNRVLAEQLVERLRPRLEDLLEELLDAERGAEEDAVPRVEGITPEGYAKAMAMAARWQSGTKRRRKAG